MLSGLLWSIRHGDLLDLAGFFDGELHILGNFVAVRGSYFVESVDTGSELLDHMRLFTRDPAFDGFSILVNDRQLRAGQLFIGRYVDLADLDPGNIVDESDVRTLFAGCCSQFSVIVRNYYCDRIDLFIVDDTLVTSFKFEDSKGKTYPIIINKANGHCYVWRVSQKTGKPYPQPMKEEISIAICKELGIKYVPKKAKK